MESCFEQITCSEFHFIEVILAAVMNVLEGFYCKGSGEVREDAIDAVQVGCLCLYAVCFSFSLTVTGTGLIV